MSPILLIISSNADVSTDPATLFHISSFLLSSSTALFPGLILPACSIVMLANGTVLGSPVSLKIVAYRTNSLTFCACVGFHSCSTPQYFFAWHSLSASYAFWTPGKTRTSPCSIHLRPRCVMLRLVV